MPSALNMLSKHERASYCNRYWENQFKKVCSSQWLHINTLLSQVKTEINLLMLILDYKLSNRCLSLAEYDTLLVGRFLVIHGCSCHALFFFDVYWYMHER